MGDCYKNILVNVKILLSVKIIVSVFPWEIIQERKCVKVPGKITAVTGGASSVSHVPELKLQAQILPLGQSPTETDEQSAPAGLLLIMGKWLFYNSNIRWMNRDLLYPWKQKHTEQILILVGFETKHKHTNIASLYKHFCT